METTALDERLISDESRAFATELFARFPEFRRYAAMERPEGQEAWQLVVHVPAPSDDPQSQLIVWVDGGDDPSVGFGDWHTHEDVWGAGLDDGAARAALFDLIGGILADRFVLCDDVGGSGHGTSAILDLSKDDALLEELTNKYSPGRVRLRSWSGRLDREVGLDDLGRDEPA